jgi:hypothetical protein
LNTNQADLRYEVLYKEKENTLLPLLFFPLTSLILSLAKVLGKLSSPRSCTQQLGTISGKSLLLTGIVVHTCNPNYSEGRDWEDCSFRLAQDLVRSYLNKHTRHGGEFFKSQL